MIIVMKLLEQNAIADLVSEKRAINFIAKRNSNKEWVVEFLHVPTTLYGDPIKKGVRTRRGRKRSFLRLNGVEKFMKLVGAKEFTVIL